MVLCVKFYFSPLNVRMFCFNSAWLTLFYFCYLIALADSQATRDNPYIWQVLTEFDLAESNKTKVYLPETSLKVYSQDFQTVFEHKDFFGYNERLVLDLGDACNETTIEQIEQLNDHWAMSPSMKSQPSIGLVKRRGRCLQWSEKITNVQYLSKQYGLQVSGIVIHDDISYNETNFIQEETYNASFPTWTGNLPDNRNVDFMTQENRIDKGSTFIAVYFVSYSYMEFLNQTLLKKIFEKNGSKQTYTQLTFSLNENHFVTTSDPKFTGTSTDNINSTSKSLWDQERDKRNYIIFSVTAAVIIILVYIITRWCRAVRLSSQNLEQNMSLQDLNLSRNRVVPFLELDTISPFLLYNKASMTNSACAICLDDFQGDFFVRVLPCRHGYCTACIDVWLTKKSSLCPICKYDCILAKNDTLEEEP